MTDLSRTSCKVVFNDGNEVRVLRGFIVDEDEHFITVSRSDGIVRIAKRTIIKMDYRETS